MPRYIDHIWGYSSSTHRMYFRDTSGAALISSFDCIHFELTDEDKDVNNCDDADHADHNSNYCASDLKDTGSKGLAVNVPGKPLENYPEAEIPDTNIKGKRKLFLSKKIFKTIKMVDLEN